MIWLRWLARVRPPRHPRRRRLVQPHPQEARTRRYPRLYPFQPGGCGHGTRGGVASVPTMHRRAPSSTGATSAGLQRGGERTFLPRRSLCGGCDWDSLMCPACSDHENNKGMRECSPQRERWCDRDRVNLGRARNSLWSHAAAEKRQCRPLPASENVNRRLIQSSWPEDHNCAAVLLFIIYLKGNASLCLM